MVAWVICGVIGFAWLHGKEKARHALKMGQAQAHHDEVKEMISELDLHVRELISIMEGKRKDAL